MLLLLLLLAGGDAAPSVPPPPLASASGSGRSSVRTGELRAPSTTTTGGGRAAWLTRFHMALNSGPPHHHRWYQQDINGPITINGTHHVFVLGHDLAGGRGWIHATSSDMVHWLNHGLTINANTGSITRAPSGDYVALYPFNGGIGWSTAVDGAAGLLLQNWTAPIAAISAVACGWGCRDAARPFAIPGQRGLYMIAAGGVPKTGPAQATLFHSTDPKLQRWTRQPRPLFETNVTAFGQVTDTFECPDVFPLSSSKWVFLASLWQSSDPAWFGAPSQHSEEYVIGELDEGGVMQASHRAVLDHGYFYAAKTLAAENESNSGRRVLFGWLNPNVHQRPPYELCPPDSNKGPYHSCWIGTQPELLPRELTLVDDDDDDDGDDTASILLRFAPITELEALRSPLLSAGNRTLQCNGPAAVWPSVRGLQLDLIATVTVPSVAAGEVGIEVLRSTGGEETTRIGLNVSAADGSVTGFVDRRQSSLAASVANTSLMVAPLRARHGETVELRILLDGSVIEVFFNYTVAITSRSFPTRADSVGTAAFFGGGCAQHATARVQLTAFAMKPIVPLPS